jgi:two-component system chemotaxis response regulator CheY
MKVLVVDDSATLRKIAIKAVKDAGFAVEFAEAGDGLEALEELEKDEYALVLSDLNMPRMDGVELVRQLRASGSRVPIVMLTAETGLAKLQQALAAGADDCLRNPFTPQQFRDKLGRFLG